MELLIGIVITGALFASLLSLLTGQAGFYRSTEDSILTQQSVRALTDLVSGELRMVGSDDVIAAEADSVSVRVDLSRGIVCDTTVTDQAIVFWYDSATTVSLVGGVSGYAYTDPFDEDYQYADGWSPSTDATGAGPKATCTGNGAPGTAPDANYVSMSGWTGSFTGGVPDRGAVVRQYGRLTYRFASSVFASGIALWRGPDELVAPLQSGAGFSYLLGDGSVVTSVSGANLANIDAVILSGVALGDGSASSGIIRSFEVRVPLRN